MSGVNATADLVRQAIYGVFAERGVAPTRADVARICNLGPSAVDEAYRTLADAHVIVLAPGTGELWAAPPFAAFDSAFRVTHGGRSWFGVCAWDAFGIPATLHSDCSIDSTCAWSGAPISCGVRASRAFGDAVIHLLVPAAHFWDDIVYT